MTKACVLIPGKVMISWIWIYHSVLSRLVVSDVSFYLNSVKSLSGLADLEDNMDAIWDKTWRNPELLIAPYSKVHHYIVPKEHHCRLVLIRASSFHTPKCDSHLIFPLRMSSPLPAAVVLNSSVCDKIRNSVVWKIRWVSWNKICVQDLKLRTVYEYW